MKNKLEIIAEVAQGYEGNLDICLLYIRAAKKSKANAVKFQMVYADDLSVPNYKYYNLFKTLEIKHTDWKKISNLCKEINIDLQVDIFGEKSLKTANSLGIRTVKLHGTDTNNLNLLSQIASSSLERIILGIGGAKLDEIENAINILKNKNITLMHGYQGYPTPVNSNQLSRIKYLINYFKKKNITINFGFGDHSENNSNNLYFSLCLSSLAIGLGASSIEKHLTLSNVIELEDFESALNPDDFSLYTYILNKSYNSIGEIKEKNDFGMSIKETKYRNTIRRDVVAKKDLKSGTVLSSKHITLKRTSIENPIKNIEDVYGKKIIKSLKANDNIIKDFIENR